MNMNKENKSPEGTGIMACDSINSKIVNPELNRYIIPYYNTILQLFKQTPDYINQFSVLSTSFDSGSSFKPDFIIDIPDLDKIQEVAMKKTDEKYAPSFTYNDYAQDYDDINVDSRAAYEEGFFDGGKYMFDILNGTKVDNN